MTGKVNTKGLLYVSLLSISIVFILSALILGFRLLTRVDRFGPPRPRETNISLIQPWMTVPYISRTYGVPSEILYKKLGLNPLASKRLSLDRIAKQQKKLSSAVIKDVQDIITQFQQEHALPPVN
jgi:hypothetical protein